MFFLEKSVLARMNFARIGTESFPMRNSGKVFFIAVETTISDGQMFGRIVRSHEPKDFQTVRGTLVDNATMIPCATSPTCMNL